MVRRAAVLALGGADGQIRLKVVSSDAEGLRARVVTGGKLSDHKGVAFPQSELRTPVLTPYLGPVVFTRTELDSEPWYPVGRLDVFPEEFATFVLGNPDVREVFCRHHADLLSPAFWQDAQRRIGEGEIVDFFPYPERLRFSSPGSTSPVS